MRGIMMAGVVALAVGTGVRPADAGVSSPAPWLSVWTGPTGYSVELNAQVYTTVLSDALTPIATGPVDTTFFLSDVTELMVNMAFMCATYPGCTVSAPLEVTINGSINGGVYALDMGENMTWNGVPFTYGSDNFVGILNSDYNVFDQTHGFTDNPEGFAIVTDAIPEPLSASILMIGLLGLGIIRTWMRHEGFS